MSGSEEKQLVIQGLPEDPMEPMTADDINDLRLRIVRDDYDPPAEEMMRMVQTLMARRGVLAKKEDEKKGRGRKSAVPAGKVDLSGFLTGGSE